ncbi:MAG TPA: molybdate ABC transporter substrate-binding protein [Vicinamibacterales bacterium]|nr:molybdate ABC transporter substrate-binding protein [Vicinamibacterales bacterium]
MLPRLVTKFVHCLAASATVLTAFSTPVAAQPPGLVVSVATSAYDALDEIAGLYRAATGVTVAINSGGSNTLARQIVEGARVGLFLSADHAQMDVVEKAGLIVPGTRVRLLTNELAVIAPDRGSTVTLAQLLKGDVTRLAMGEPAAVPAGVYGRRWLERQQAWVHLEPKVVPFATARGVVAAVDAGRVDAGIVFATDVIGSRVRVVARVAANEHPYLDISYPAAVIRGASESEARRFLEFLKAPAARAVFDKRGFGRPRE